MIVYSAGDMLASNLQTLIDLLRLEIVDREIVLLTLDEKTRLYAFGKLDALRAQLATLESMLASYRMDIYQRAVMAI